MQERLDAQRIGKAKGWGGVARKGAVHMKSTGEELSKRHVASTSGPDAVPEWVEEKRAGVTKKSKEKERVPYALPGEVASDIRKHFIGTAYMREKMVATFTKAAEGYDRHRYEEALRLGRQVADVVPDVAAVRELTGLAAYRAERWNMAKIHLKAHFDLTQDPSHLALIMDCDRAHRRFRAVEKTFEIAQSAGGNADDLAETRIVMASAWAEQRKYREAIDLLTRAGGAKKLRNPSYRHIRLWYALADVYDRAGDLVAARELFARIYQADPDAYDVRSRLEEMGVGAVRKQRKRRTVPVSKKK